ncbi:transketolase [Candidatus Pelagibacter sp.]|nr:transketolase [Candidatus Pelagibacter sp.]
MNYKNFSLKIRKLILKIANSSQCSHIGSNLSIVDILSVLYVKFLKIKKNSFILSKGHACLAQYCVLKELGFITDKTLNTFGKNGTILMSHSSHKVPGINLSTGSLGHGLPVATGIALANKINKKKSKMFVLLSDGELDEGSNWESILFSSHHKLDNLVIIIDYNKLQSTNSVKNTLNLEPLDKKFESFGCKVLTVNGHNCEKIFKALNSKSSKPLVVIANTVKGKGVSFMENSVLWHYKSLDSEDYKRALKIIK